MCKQIHSSSGRMISSHLKYSRNALHINVPPFARYFRQRFAPFIRHRRRSQGYPYIWSGKFIFLISQTIFSNWVQRHAVRSVLLRLKYLRRVSESVFLCLWDGMFWNLQNRVRLYHSQVRFPNRPFQYALPCM